MKEMSAFTPSDYCFVRFKQAPSALCMPVCMLHHVWLCDPTDCGPWGYTSLHQASPCPWE